jgi:hypothetical protein
VDAAAVDAAVLAWGDAFCGGLVGVLNGLEELEAHTSGPVPDPETLKQYLATYADTATTSLRNSRSRMEALGVPAPELQELHTSALTGYDASARETEQIAASVAALDASDPEFGTKIVAVLERMADFSVLETAMGDGNVSSAFAKKLDASPECVEMEELTAS